MGVPIPLCSRILRVTFNVMVGRIFTDVKRSIIVTSRLLKLLGLFIGPWNAHVHLLPLPAFHLSLTCF